MIFIICYIRIYIIPYITLKLCSARHRIYTVSTQMESDDVIASRLTRGLSSPVTARLQGGF